jgi:4-hydroxy-tetrahydrodipicolinate synthase
MRGVCDVIIPSYTADLKGLNEAGIRHDVRRNIELGFWGALLVSEAGTTAEEYRRFMDIAVDEARGRHHLVLHGTLDTVNDVVEMARYGEQAGMSALLLGYPNSFYPTSPEDVYDYNAYVAGRTNLATIMFVASHWNFERLHPSGFPPRVIADLSTLPNIVAVKHEVGRPGLAATYEVLQMVKDTGVLLSDPLEANSPLWVDLYGMQWMGTSNYEYWGGAVPRYFSILHEGSRDEAMKLYWQIQPARGARMAEQGAAGGANFIHRYMWKYQAWLNGYNGGPIRQPVMKLNDGQMRRLRDALARSGIEPEKADFSQFYVGRNPA